MIKIIENKVTYFKNFADNSEVTKNYKIKKLKSFIYLKDNIKL